MSEEKSNQNISKKDLPAPQEQVDFSFEKSTGKKKVRKGTKKQFK